MWRRVKCVFPLMMVVGCAVEPVQGTSSTGVPDDPTPEQPTPTTSTTTNAVTTEPEPDMAGGATSTTGTGTTTGMLPDFGEGEGCDKIDVVYVVSPFVPKEHRATVREGVLHFNERLVETFTPNIDLHIMVTDEMIEWTGEQCESECTSNGSCEASGNPEFPCGDLFNVHRCEKLAGAAHMFPIGLGAANRMCGETKHMRFLDTQTPDLLGKLDCATNKRPFDGVLAGHPTDALVTAVTGQGPDDCNQGFLRDDAILFIVYITNLAEPWDWPGTPSPEETAALLFSVKSKDQLGIAALLGDNTQPNPTCQPGYNVEHKKKIFTLVEDLIPHHVWGSICAPDVRPVFDDAIELMLDMCISYVPQ